MFCVLTRTSKLLRICDETQLFSVDQSVTSNHKQLLYTVYSHHSLTAKRVGRLFLSSYQDPLPCTHFAITFPTRVDTFVSYVLRSVHEEEEEEECCLYPLIDKPSIITQYSATLIDNIFTNELTNQIISGLLINDISGHLPIFSLTRSSPKRLNSLKYKTIRKSSKESVDAFIEDLNRQTWHNTYKSDDEI